jgi:hypothetical protein
MSFRIFRNIALKEDGLEPLHFYSIPGLSWSSAFKSTESKVDFMRDITMYEWFESAIRGGLAFVNTHFCKRIPDVCELLYLDVNNLYGWALSEPLPYGNLKWVDDDKLLADLISNL